MGNKSSKKAPPPPASKPPANCQSNTQLVATMVKHGLDPIFAQRVLKNRPIKPGVPPIDYDKMIAELERQRKIRGYQDDYNQAKDNLIHGPDRLGKATYNLLDFTQGEAGYNSYLQTYLNQRVGEMEHIVTAKFLKEMLDLTYLIAVYESTYQASRNTVDLYYQYIGDNAKLENKINQDHASISRNNRKSFYEDDKLITMKQWYSRFTWIYYFFLFFYVIAIAFFSETSFKMKVVFIGFFVTLPFFIVTVYVPMFLGLLNMMYNINEYYIPKNVYTGRIVEDPVRHGMDDMETE